MHVPVLLMRVPGASWVKSVPLVVAGLYAIGLLLLETAFAYSDNPALRNAVFTTLSLPAPSVMTALAALLFTIAVLCLLAGYVLLFNWSSGPFDARKQSTAWKLLVLFPLLFLALPPFLSTDVLSYYQQGWLIAEKHVSPYTTPPGAFDGFPGSDLMKESNQFLLSPYGPLWSLLEGAVYRLSGGALWLGVVLFKLLAAAAALLLTFLVWKVLKTADPANATRGAILVGANPLILIEGPGMAHNDLVALAVAFAGITLLVRGQGRATVVGLATIGASLLIKALVASPRTTRARGRPASARLCRATRRTRSSPA